MDKETLFSRRRFSLRRVDLSEWAQPGETDACIYVRGMTSRERRKIGDLINDENGVEHPDSAERLIAAYACDENGTQLFSTDDIPALSELDRRMVETIGMAILRHNKLVKDALDDAEKN